MTQLIPLRLQSSQASLNFAPSYTTSAPPAPSRAPPPVPPKSGRRPVSRILSSHLPCTATEWRHLMDEVKALYKAKRNKQCSSRCIQVLGKADAPPHPLYTIILSFYAATALESSATPLSSASEHKLPILEEARNYYQRAEVCIKLAGRTAAISFTNQINISHFPNFPIPPSTMHSRSTSASSNKPLPPLPHNRNFSRPISINFSMQPSRDSVQVQPIFRVAQAESRPESRSSLRSNLSIVSRVDSVLSNPNTASTHSRFNSLASSPATSDDEHWCLPTADPAPATQSPPKQTSAKPRVGRPAPLRIKKKVSFSQSQPIIISHSRGPSSPLIPYPYCSPYPERKSSIAATQYTQNGIPSYPRHPAVHPTKLISHPMCPSTPTYPRHASTLRSPTPSGMSLEEEEEESFLHGEIQRTHQLKYLEQLQTLSTRISYHLEAIASQIATCHLERARRRAKNQCGADYFRERSGSVVGECSQASVVEKEEKVEEVLTEAELEARYEEKKERIARLKAAGWRRERFDAARPRMIAERAMAEMRC